MNFIKTVGRIKHYVKCNCVGCVLTAGYENGYQKLAIVASLQRAKKTAIRKLAIVASLQRAKKTGIDNSKNHEFH